MIFISAPEQLLAWYDKHARVLPWRSMKGETPNPYYVYISEVLLQQTTVQTVIPYFEKFIKRWPTLQDLASASLDEVLKSWEGLGYYRRAHYLYQSVHILNKIKIFPLTAQEWRKLPGIGPYTSAAVTSIAFQEPVLPIDGNIRRIMSRVYASKANTAELDSAIHNDLVWVSKTRPGDVAQALMDLGATICRPSKPLCHVCPLSSHCQAYQEGQPQNYPYKLKTRTIKKMYGYVWGLFNDHGQIWIEKRANQGLLAGLYQLPSTPWEETLQVPNDSMTYLPQRIRHVFSHFKLELIIGWRHISAPIPLSFSEEGFWVNPQDLHQLAFSTLMKKVLYSLKEVSYVFQKKEAS